MECVANYPLRLLITFHDLKSTVSGVAIVIWYYIQFVSTHGRGFEDLIGTSEVIGAIGTIGTRDLGPPDRD